MTVFLPKSVEAVLQGTSKDNARFVMSAVKLTARDDGGFRVDATDGRKAIVIQEGFYDPTPADIRREDLAYEVARPSDAKQILIEGTDLAQAFKLVRKGERLCVRIENDRAILVAGDTVKTALAVNGRFPPLDDVMPKQQPCLMVRLSPSVLIPALKAAQMVAPEEGVLVCVYPDGADGVNEKPLGLTLKTAEGLLFDALVMPMIGEREKRQREAKQRQANKESHEELEENGRVSIGKACPKVGCDGTVRILPGQGQDGECTHCEFKNPPSDDLDDCDEPAVLPFNPENALKLVADDAERLRGCDLERLMGSMSNYENAEEMACWIAERRPDLVDKLIDAFSQDWIVEPCVVAALRDVGSGVVA